MEIFSTEYALLGVQSALLDVVSPELRAVVVDFCKDNNQLFLCFYYDGDVSEKLIDLWECAITEASAGLGPDCILDDYVLRLDYPKKIPLRGRYAYFRMEEPARNSGVAIHFESEIVEYTHSVGSFTCPVSGELISTNYGIKYSLGEGEYIIPVKPKTHKIDIFPLAYALLSLQKALLGIVVPQLRAVIVDINNEEKLLYIRFYYDRDACENLISLWRWAIMEARADMGCDYKLDAQVEKLNYPQEIPFRGRYAYSRKE
ncbi:MAG: hypothetical protein K2P51_05490 [Rhabdochlamydiaceae bacterium]|nr:hypothetical protein [Rhabdochlamydiaceae bacterium]